MNHSERITPVIKLNLKLDNDSLKMIRSNFWDYSNVYIHVKGTITPEHRKQQQPQIIPIKKVIFQNCTPFTNYVSEKNNT